MLTVNSTINLAGQAVPNIIPAVQGDTGRVVVFTLADFTIPAGSTATYYVQKPSGEAVYNAATINDNKVTVELTAQALAETGDNYGQVRILNGEDVVTSFDFILLVKPFRGIEAIASTTEMNIFDEAVEQAREEIAEAAEEAKEYISTAIDPTLTIEGKAADAKAAGDMIRAAFATDTASGSVASFPDGADGVPVKSLSVAVEAVQSGSGDPSPSNVRPISGWDAVKVFRTGKNLMRFSLSPQTIAGVTFTQNDDGTITANGTATSDAMPYIAVKSGLTACGFMGLKGQKVIVSACPAGGSASTYFAQWARLDGSTIITDMGNGATVTIGDYDTASSVYVRICIKNGYTANNLVFKPMIRFASESDATYEPYNGTVYDINILQTVYGGTLDVSTGELTITHEAVDMGTLSWSRYTAYTNALYRTSVPRQYSSEHPNVYGLCSCYAWYGNATLANMGDSMPDKQYGFQPTSAFLCVRDDEYTDAESFKTAVTGQMMFYPLAEPQTLSLTPEQVTTLLGQNNIYADAGSVAVTYRADTGLYIDKRLNA